MLFSLTMYFASLMADIYRKVLLKDRLRRHGLQRLYSICHVFCGHLMDEWKKED
jgi:hypothetical protein